MNVLIINCGSSSLKYQLLDMDDRSVMASGLVERIGESKGTITQKYRPGSDSEKKLEQCQPVPDHAGAMRLVVSMLMHDVCGAITSLDQIDAVGHRVVQGGETFSRPALVDEGVVAAIRENIPLAPLHNPANLTGIEQARDIFPGTPNVAVFDTEFFQTVPQKAFMYPLPMALYDELKVRKYGFHGTSHRFVVRTAAEHLGKAVDEVNLVTMHLGNGCSMAAVKNGRAVDTTMGLTPLAGLMMGTRCGDIDPAIHAFLAENKGMGIAEIDTMLNKQSGLLGVCGMNDMRDIHKAREEGDEAAQLAFEMFAYRVKQTLGAYLAIIGGADAIVFTAGIGENDANVRAEVCKGLEPLGIELDEAANAQRAPGIRELHRSGGKVQVLVVPTDEELEIACATMDVLQEVSNT